MNTLKVAENKVDIKASRNSPVSNVFDSKTNETIVEMQFSYYKLQTMHNSNQHAEKPLSRKNRKDRLSKTTGRCKKDSKRKTEIRLTLSIVLVCF